MKKLPAILIAVLLLGGCANWQQWQQTLGTPQQVQRDITALGLVSKPRIPANAQAAIHKYATDLNQVADANSGQLIGLIPHTGNYIADAFIQSTSLFVNMALAKFGEHNPTTLAYVRAAANGLLANF